MSQLSRMTTLLKPDSIRPSAMNDEFNNIVNTWNNHDNGTLTWNNLKVKTFSPTANIAMGGFKLTGLGAGTGNGDSLRYEQLIGLYLLLTGGTMSGAIAMGANKITGLANGTAATDAAAFGQVKLLQTVTATSTTAATTTSNTFGATNSTVSITPTSASNRILLMASSAGSTSNEGLGAQFTFARGTTVLSGTDGIANYGSASVSTQSITFPISMCYVDSPATTSATSYTVYFRAKSGSPTIGYGISANNTQVIIAQEIV